MKVRAGVSDCGITRNNPILMKAGEQVSRILGLIGPGNIQGKIVGDKFVVFEVNPRFSGGIPLTIASGCDFPEMIIKLMRGQQVEPGTGNFINGLIMQCHEEPFFMHKPRFEQTVTPCSHKESMPMVAYPSVQNPFENYQYQSDKRLVVMKLKKNETKGSDVASASS